MPRKAGTTKKERPHRDLLQIPDFSAREIDRLFVLAESMRTGKYKKKPLAGKSLAMIFMKSSTRTRVSFEVGAWQLGGHALFLSPRDVQLGRGEPIADTARVLSRYVDGIMIRTFAHAEVEELAQYATVPIINGLTDLVHPCQVLADLLTVQQHLGGYKGKRVAWIGDGNNMANSWINAAYVLGFELTLACPEGYEPNPDDPCARAVKGEGARGARSGRGRKGCRRRSTPTSGRRWARKRSRRSARRRSRDIASMRR